MGKFLSKLVPKNIAGILGVVQTALPFVRELLMLVTRVATVLIPGDGDDKVIAVIKKYFDIFETNFIKFKNFFLPGV